MKTFIRIICHFTDPSFKVSVCYKSNTCSEHFIRNGWYFGMWKLLCGLVLQYTYDNKVLVVQLQPLEVSTLVREEETKKQ